MADTIEAFVNKLQNDGVEAGRKEAERIISEANENAAGIISDAEAKAGKIIEDANSKAESIKNKTRTELTMASRDALLKLQDAVVRGISAVLAGPVEENLDDKDFLAGVIQQAVTQYAEALARNDIEVEINVKQDMRDKLSDIVIRRLKEAEKTSGASVNIHGMLEKSGFEYKITDSTVEVTQESIVELLSSMTSPRLKHIIKEAVKE